jgi:hypothetical protein
MADCSYLNTCPIFQKFKNEGAKNFWINQYCQGPKQDECERKKLATQGQEVPADLLPNGQKRSYLK